MEGETRGFHNRLAAEIGSALVVCEGQTLMHRHTDTQGKQLYLH